MVRCKIGVGWIKGCCDKTLEPEDAMSTERKKWLEVNWPGYANYLNVNQIAAINVQFRDDDAWLPFAEKLIMITPALSDLKAEMEATP
jgi:hypothetical protein